MHAVASLALSIRYGHRQEILNVFNALCIPSLLLVSQKPLLFGSPHDITFQFSRSLRISRRALDPEQSVEFVPVIPFAL